MGFVIWCNRWQSENNRINNEINNFSRSLLTTDLSMEKVKEIDTTIEASTKVLKELAKEIKAYVDSKKTQNWFQRNKKLIIITALAVTALAAQVLAASYSQKNEDNNSRTITLPSNIVAAVGTAGATVLAYKYGVEQNENPTIILELIDKAIEYSKKFDQFINAYKELKIRERIREENSLSYTRYASPSLDDLSTFSPVPSPVEAIAKASLSPSTIVTESPTKSPVKAFSPHPNPLTETKTETKDESPPLTPEPIPSVSPNAVRLGFGEIVHEPNSDLDTPVFFNKRPFPNSPYAGDEELEKILQQCAQFYEALPEKYKNAEVRTRIVSRIFKTMPPNDPLMQELGKLEAELKTKTEPPSVTSFHSPSIIDDKGVVWTGEKGGSSSSPSQTGGFTERWEILTNKIKQRLGVHTKDFILPELITLDGTIITKEGSLKMQEKEARVTIQDLKQDLK